MFCIINRAFLIGLHDTEACSASKGIIKPLCKKYIVSKYIFNPTLFSLRVPKPYRKCLCLKVPGSSGLFPVSWFCSRSFYLLTVRSEIKRQGSIKCAGSGGFSPQNDCFCGASVRSRCQYPRSQRKKRLPLLPFPQFFPPLLLSQGTFSLCTRLRSWTARRRTPPYSTSHLTHRSLFPCITFDNISLCTYAHSLLVLKRLPKNLL